MSALAQTSVMVKAGIALGAILAVTFLLLFLSLILQGNFSSVVANPVAWFGTLDESTAFDIVATSAELLAAVLAIAITVIAIIVELAANRYSHRITSLFVREPINIVVMCFFVVATVYTIWIAITLEARVEDPLVLNAGLFVSLIMVTLSLVILLPYFAYVMTFLSPLSVIGKIRKSGLSAIRKMDEDSLSQSQAQFLNAVDELQDIARRSSELSDRAVETESINAMLHLTVEYQDLISHIENECPDWFEMNGMIVSDPDFVSINRASLQQISEERLWVEVKILRQYLDLISDSNPTTRDTSYLIAINTKHIAINSLKRRPGLELVELCMRCFNSYLRATINNKDARTGYYIMNQYRMLAEELFRSGQADTVKEIARYLQFYGLLGFKLGIPFLLEVAAEDVGALTAESIDKDPGLLDELLSLLLDLDQEVKNEYQEDSLLGVRRAQLKLALKLMLHGDRPRALRICADISTEKPQRKEELLALLRKEDRKEYWEFTDRGVNFAYISPDEKSQLELLVESL